MRRRNLIYAAIAAGIVMLGSAGGAGAQTAAPPAPSPSQAEPSPARLKLAERILDDMGGRANLTAMMNAISSSLFKAMSSNASMPPATVQALKESMTETMDALVPRMLRETAGLYAEDFTEDQLADIAAFYESPTGKVMVAKLPQIGQQSGDLARKYLPDIQAGLMARFCRKVDCTGDQMKKYLPQAG
jgi:hypothetical protein